MTDPDWRRMARGPLARERRLTQQDTQIRIGQLRSDLATARTVTRRLLDGWSFGELLDDEDGGCYWVRPRTYRDEDDEEPMSDAERAWLRHALDAAGTETGHHD